MRVSLNSLLLLLLLLLCCYCVSCPEAKKILETLNKGRHSEASILNERVTLCEHLFQLGNGNIEAMKLDKLKVHVGQTQEFWGKYTLDLQTRIAGRHAQEALDTACATFLKVRKEGASNEGVQAWKSACDKFVSFFQWDAAGLIAADDDDQFLGDSPSFQPILKRMVRDSGDLLQVDLDAAMEGEDEENNTAAAKLESHCQAHQIVAELRILDRGPRHHLVSRDGVGSDLQRGCQGE